MDTRGWPSSAATDEMAAESIPKAEEAVDRYRRLVETAADTYLPDLANALNTLALDLDRVGSSEQALSCLEEAIGHYRRLAETTADTHLPGLATSLRNLACTRRDGGRHEQALALPAGRHELPATRRGQPG